MPKMRQNTFGDGTPPGLAVGAYALTQTGPLAAMGVPSANGRGLLIRGGKEREGAYL